MIQAFNILQNIDRIGPSKFFAQAVYKGTRSHNMNLFKPQFQSELRKHAFSQRITDDWNSLSENIVASESLEILNERLDKPWSTRWISIE